MSQSDSKHQSRRTFLTAILSACAAMAVGLRPAKADEFCGWRKGIGSWVSEDGVNWTHLP